MFGIEISEADWNCKSLPAKLITDMGCGQEGANLLDIDRETLALTLLPTTERH